MGKESRRDRNREKRKFQSEQLEKRIKQSQDRQQFKNWILDPEADVPLWSPGFEQHTIDIIPYYAGKKDPNTEHGNGTYTFAFFVHQRIGAQNKTYICPEMYGDKCPICEYRNKLRMKNDPKYKSYFPKPRHLYNVVVLDNDKEKKKGVQIWDVSYHYFEKHLAAISKKPARAGREEKIINFADPEKGSSVIFEIEKPKSEDDYPKFIGHTLDERDYEIDDDILEQARKLDELVVVESYDTIKEEFFGEDGEPAESDKKNKRQSEKNKEKEDKPEEKDYEELIEKLDDIEDNEELQDFLEENDLDDDIEIDDEEKFKNNRKTVKKKLEKMQEENQDSDKKNDKKESKYTKDDLEDMSFKKLKKLVKEEDLHNIDLDDYEDEDTKDELIEEICDALDIDIE